MKVITDEKKINKLFERNTVSEILPTREDFIKLLSSGKRLTIYIGFDPTGKALHLGHLQNILFLEDLRLLGHKVIILFGDFTARIGDPTDKTSVRSVLSKREVINYAKGWKNQIKSVLNIGLFNNPAKVKFNSKWLGKLSFSDVIKIASNFTVSHMLERDMFQKRISSDMPIHLHEFFYPLMQGYDSVAMDVDVELCATDQIFNALAGRTLLKKIKGKEKNVVALRLVANPKTGEMMSKSEGKGVFLDQNHFDMYGAIMAQPDEMTKIFFESCTRLPMGDWKDIEELGEKNAKMRIAREIVKIIFGEKKAQEAQESFEKTFSRGGIPDDIKEIQISTNLVDSLVKEEIISSKTDWRRLIDDGAIKNEKGEKITDKDFVPEKGDVLKIGKHRFVRIK